MIDSSSSARPTVSDTPTPPSPTSQAIALRFPTVRPLVTYVLLAAIIAIYVAIYFIDSTSDPGVSNPILDFGVLDYNRVVHYGEWYRLFTAMFLHLSPAHILFNGYALWRFGKSVEGMFGHVRFSLIYFLGGFAGSLASLILGRDASAGASGAIFAIFGAEIVFIYLHQKLLGAQAMPALRELVILALVNFGLGILSGVAPGGEQIDNWAHLGGFVGGLVLAWAIAPRYVIEFEMGLAPRLVDKAPFRERWPLALAGAMLLVLVTLVAAAQLN